MKTLIIAAFAACLFAGIVAGTLAPGAASAHAELTAEELAVRVTNSRYPTTVGYTHNPEFPTISLQKTHNSITVIVEPGHYHPGIPYMYETEARTPFSVALSTTPLDCEWPRPELALHRRSALEQTSPAGLHQVRYFP